MKIELNSEEVIVCGAEKWSFQAAFDNCCYFESCFELSKEFFERLW